MHLQRVTIVGMGLIGGSIARDLKERKLVHSIIGVDQEIKHLEFAKEKGWIDRAIVEIKQEVVEVELVLLTTPLAALTSILQSLSQLSLPETVVISDVGSTKANVIEAFRTHLPQHFDCCLAGHPLAGRERSGIQYAELDLFMGQKVVLCPHERQKTASLMLLSQFWRDLGAQVYEVPAELHDQIVAMTSHFPHLLAYVFMNQLAKSELKGAYLEFAGSGFRDFTRIAAGDPELWMQICIQNRTFLLELLQQYRGALDICEEALKKADKKALKGYFSTSQKIRSRWGRAKK
ncbi:MAG: prephenate dehydrogenase [Neisseriaceae bacterium]